jgi:DHA1 family tetracycline resistance protein-like MFS transporter
MKGTRVAGKAAFGFALITAVLDTLAIGIVFPVLPTLIAEFTGSNARAGAISGAFIALFALIQFISAPVIGALSDRYGRRPAILLSTLGLTADYALTALAPNLGWLVLGRIIAGVTSSTMSAVNAYVADVTPANRRARAYGLIGAATSAGFVLGPVMGGILGAFSPRAPFWVAGSVSAVSFVYGLFILPESLPAEHRAASTWRRANPFSGFTLLRSRRELSGLAMVCVVLFCARSVLAPVFVLYASGRYGWSTSQVGAQLTLIGTLDVLVQGLLVGPVTRRFGDRNVMIFGMFAGAVGLGWMGVAPTGRLFVFAVLPSALWGMAIPTLKSLMTRLVSESDQGKLQGAIVSVSSFAGIAAPVFFGAIYSMSTGDFGDFKLPGLAFLISAVMLLGGGILGWRVVRRTV